uniref:ComEC/Rec2 family competence protein n=1 Tax=Thomasclavelia sp. TaxID=3025757 RepID=UPI00345DF58F
GGLRNKDVASLTVVPYLHSLGIFSLDYVFLSHDDFDHSGGYDSLASQIKIKETITAYQEKMKIGEVIIEMLALPASDNNNDSSLVMLVTVNHLKYLFTGDISSNVEAKIIQDYPNLQVDVLKVSHHGSNSGTSAPFLASIKPKVALISCGKNNTYGHPHDDLLQRLNDYGVKVYRTDQMGMVKIVYYGDDNYLFKKIN